MYDIVDMDIVLTCIDVDAESESCLSDAGGLKILAQGIQRGRVIY